MSGQKPYRLGPHKQPFVKKGLIAGRWGERKKECFTGVTELQNDDETVINK